MRIAEGVHADDRVLAGVLQMLVVHRLVLDLAALIAGLHCTQHTAALRNPLEFGQHRFFDQLGELVDDKAALQRILVFRQTPFAIDDQLDRHGTTHTVFGRRGDRLIKRIGVQAVGIVVGGNECLQRGADVVELDLLRMQAAPAGLAVILELLAALVGAVLVAHGHRPDAPGHATQHGVFRVHAVAEEKAQVGCEIIDPHAARQIGLDEGEAIGQREGKLADRVGPGLGDVITADRDRIEIAHIVLDKILGDVAHHLQAELG